MSSITVCFHEKVVVCEMLSAGVTGCTAGVTGCTAGVTGCTAGVTGCTAGVIGCTAVIYLVLCNTSFCFNP